MTVRTGWRAVVRGAGAALIAGALHAGGVEIEPASPTKCDELFINVTRTFTSDCKWILGISNEVDPGPPGTMKITLVPLRGADSCLPVVIDQTFRKSLGTFPPAAYHITVQWSDLKPPPDEFDIEIADGPCEGYEFRRGDVNLDEEQNLSDAVTILGFLFLGDAISCRDPADVDGNREIDLTDAVYLLDHLFLGGPEPPAPFPDCGPLPDGVATLGCDEPGCPPPGAQDPAWMIRADGCFQCDPCNAPSLKEVVAALEESGIRVQDSREDSVPVCAACGCASGRFFAVLVSAEDAKTLEADGWTRSPANG